MLSVLKSADKANYFKAGRGREALHMRASGRYPRKSLGRRSTSKKSRRRLFGPSAVDEQSVCFLTGRPTAKIARKVLETGNDVLKESSSSICSPTSNPVRTSSIYLCLYQDLSVCMYVCVHAW